jgi:UDP-glucose 4-epimerase
MRVTVTGDAGYIGSVVTEVLLGEGHEVLVIDDLSKGHRDAVPAVAGFVQAGLAEGRTVAAALRSFQTDAVVHMAVYSLVGESVGCGGNGHTVREVIDAAARITGHPIATRRAARRVGDPPVLVASSEGIQREQGWQPRYDLEDMVSSAWRAMQTR